MITAQNDPIKMLRLVNGENEMIKMIKAIKFYCSRKLFDLKQEAWILIKKVVVN